MSLTGFLFFVTVILTIGFTKRPTEDNIWKLRAKVLSSTYRFSKWEKGLVGEQTVAGELEKLPNNYYVINDIIVYNNNRKAQIDHVVVGPTGVFAIETKTMGGNLRPHPNGWLQGRTLIKSPQKQSYYGAEILSKLINHYVQAVVVLANPRARWLGGFDPICPVVYNRHLRNFILKQPAIIPNPSDLVKKIPL